MLVHFNRAMTTANHGSSFSCPLTIQFNRLIQHAGEGESADHTARMTHYLRTEAFK